MAERIAGIWWFMFWVSVAVVAFVGALLVVGMVRRRRRSGDDGAETEEPTSTRRWEGRLLLFGGVVGPLLILFVLWLLTLRDVDLLAEPPRPPALTVDVVGRLWWWEVRYPQHRIVSANEVHIPVGQPVRLRLTTNGVIHSFWVPQLAGKTDMITGKVNTMWLEAERPGVYRGQCAEYCGIQHANMAFFVIAHPEAAFQQWLAEHASIPPEPTDPLLERGRSLFVTGTCATCHTIRGTPATGTVGPDLTNFGSRLTIGAGAVPNRPGYLGGWIVDSQSIKPGNLMPPIQVGAHELQALIAYLQSLK
ncbi:MAG: cytochrome c oxidase subunit II [Actinomycetota bacterium]|nr:cytochrome c oxidase subunit II [Actinomycetota bacterium]